MIVAEYNTIEEYKEANLKAHNTCVGLDNYNSPMYASENGIMSINDTYLLPLVPQFEKELKEAGLNFVEIENSYIKVIEL